MEYINFVIIGVAAGILSGFFGIGTLRSMKHHITMIARLWNTGRPA